MTLSQPSSRGTRTKSIMRNGQSVSEQLRKEHLPMERMSITFPSFPTPIARTRSESLCRRWKRRKPFHVSRVFRKSFHVSRVIRKPFNAGRVIRKPFNAGRVIRKPFHVSRVLRKPFNANRVFRKSFHVSRVIRKPFNANRMLKRSSTIPHYL